MWVRTVPVTITVRYRAQNKQTALHFAAYKSQARVVTALARLGAVPQWMHWTKYDVQQPAVDPTRVPVAPHPLTPSPPSFTPSCRTESRPFTLRRSKAISRPCRRCWRQGHG